MSVRLIAHVNRDDDLIEAWVRHYLRMGVQSLHLIVHGAEHENITLHAMRARYPITILDQYEGVFDVFEKRDRLTWGLAKLRGGWVVLVDSDEFLELPYATVERTVAMMRWLRADALSAPMLQRFSVEGTLDTTCTISPSDAYPWCSSDLYAQLGQPQAVIDKYPVFEINGRTALRSGGNHYPPNGYGSRVAPMLGVTHHFKWRASVRQRLTSRANSTHPYRSESVQYLAYLERAQWQLPVQAAFRYSRFEMFRRGLLSRPGVVDLVTRRAHVVGIQGGKQRVFAYMVSPERVATAVARQRHAQVTLCGAGSGGAIFLAALTRYGVAVERVVDRDETRWGSRVEGIPVVGLDAALAAGDRVFVTGSLTFGSQMEAQVRERAAAHGVDVTVFSTADAEAFA